MKKVGSFASVRNHSPIMITFNVAIRQILNFIYILVLDFIREKRFRRIEVCSLQVRIYRLRNKYVNPLDDSLPFAANGIFYFVF